MKSKSIFVLLFPFLLAGCSTSTTPVGGGYYVKQTTNFSWEAGGGSRELYFHNPGGGRTLIWKYVGNAHATDGLAVFIGNTEPGKEEHSEGLFAVQGGGPLLEVGKTLLTFEAEKQQTDVSNFIHKYVIDVFSLKGSDSGFEVQCLQHGVNKPGLSLSVTWAELFHGNATGPDPGHTPKGPVGQVIPPDSIPGTGNA
jgi:hypothetical protein